MTENYLELSKLAKRKYLKTLHGYDIAELYNSLVPLEKKELFETISIEDKATLITYLDPEQAGNLLKELEPALITKIFKYLEPDDLVDIINEVDEEVSQLWVSYLDTETVEDFHSLKDYEDDEAGSIMSTNIISLTTDMEVKDAMRLLIKEAPNVETIQTLFVIDKYNSFLGVVPLKKLIKAKSPMTIDKLYETSLFVFDGDDVDEVSMLIQEEGIYQMPVLSNKHELLGMITLDDAIDAYEIEAIEDVRKLSALSEPEKAGVFKSALSRLPWLFLLLIMTLPIAVIMSGFENVIAVYTILIMFQPLILDVSGNLGTQSLSTSLIVMNLDLDIKYRRHFKDEMLSSVYIGIIMGLSGFVFSYLFVLLSPTITYNGLIFSGTIGITLFLSIVISTLFATLIPKLLEMLNFDPANASGPLITTIVDISSIIIYYGLATLLIEVFL